MNSKAFENEFVMKYQILDLKETVAVAEQKRRTIHHQTTQHNNTSRSSYYSH